LDAINDYTLKTLKVVMDLVWEYAGTVEV
jgi:hypothetical protein